MAGSGANGRHQAIVNISSKTDTTIITAPSGTARIAIHYLLCCTEVDGGNEDELIRFEDGVGGSVIATLITEMGASIEIKPPALYPIKLTAATALNAETTGTGTGSFSVLVIYSVL